MVKIRLRRRAEKCAVLPHSHRRLRRVRAMGSSIEIIGQYAPVRSRVASGRRSESQHWLNLGAQPHRHRTVAPSARRRPQAASRAKTRHRAQSGRSSAQREVRTKPPAPRAQVLNDWPEYAIVGLIRKAQGIRGEVVIEPLTDKPDVVFASGSRCFCGNVRR